MSWHPQTACILPWDNHALIEAYTSPIQPIFSLPISSYLGMEYHPKYWTHLCHLKGIQEGHHHQDLLHIHNLLTLVQR